MIEIKRETLPDGYIFILVSMNPLSERRISTQMPAGMTLDWYVESVCPERYREHVSIFLQGDHVPRKYWHRVKPKPGATVYLKLTPADPVSLVAVLAPIAGNLTAGAIFGGLTAAGALAAGGLTAFGFFAVSAAVAFGVLAIGQALFGPEIEAATSEAGAPSFSLSGARNRLAAYEAVPVVFGQFRTAPPYAAAPFTENSGNESFLRFAVLWGYAPVTLSSVKIGNTNIGSFQGVGVQNDLNGAGTSLSLYPFDVAQDQLAITLNQTAVVRATPQACTEIIVDFTFPEGLSYFAQDSTNRSVSRLVVFQYRLQGNVTWIDLFNAPITRATSEPVRLSARVAGLPLGIYEIRAFAGSEPATSRWLPAQRSRVDWVSLRAYDTTAPITTLPGVAKSAYRLQASDQLSGVVDQLNAYVQCVVPIPDGSGGWTSSGFSNNPAAMFRHALTGSFNQRPVPAAQIDDAHLLEWFNFCAARGLVYERVIERTISLGSLLQEIAAAGFASPVYQDDKWSVIIERPRSTVVQHFTPRNTRNFQGRVVFPEIPHALRIRFANRDEEYREAERTVYDDGFNAGNATIFQRLNLPGVTSPSAVYQLARHFIASLRLRPEQFTVEVDVEHLVVTRGDRCYLTHDVPKIGQVSFRVRSVSGNQIELDETINLNDALSYAMTVRKADGTIATFSVDDQIDLNTVSLVSTPTGVSAGDLGVLGEVESEKLDVLVKGIEYLDGLTARLTLVPYVEALYDSANAIPQYDPVLSTPVSASFTGPGTPRITNVVSDERALTRTRAGDIELGVLVFLSQSDEAPSADGTVTPAQSFQVRYRETGDLNARFTYTPFLPVDTESIRLKDVRTGQVLQIEARAIGPSGETSSYARAPDHTVIGAVARPPVVNTLRINNIGQDHASLEWDYPDAPNDLVGFEVRYHPDPDVTSWQRMTQLSDRIDFRQRSFTVPSRNGSFGIKPIDVLGQRPIEATFVNASLEDPDGSNVVETIKEDPDFTGTLTDLFYSAGDQWLQLGSGTVMADWPTLAGIPTLIFGAGPDQGVIDIGYYEFGEIDLTEVYTSRLSISMNAGIIGYSNLLSGWTTLSSVETLSGDTSADDTYVYVEVATSLIDGPVPVYGEYRRFVVGDYTGRHLKFRLVLGTARPDVTPFVDALTVHVDMPDRISTAEDVVSGAGTASVTFSPAFRVLKSVTLNGQDLQTGDYFDITNKSRTGFDVTFRNSAGTPVSRTFDWQAIGYGRERAT